jgi:hypothetical protein
MPGKKIIASQRVIEQSKMTVSHDQPSSPPERLSRLYDEIGAEKAEAARKIADAIKERDNSSVFDTGDALIKMKEELGHGNWERWVPLALGWTTRHAQRYMAVARRLGAHRWSRPSQSGRTLRWPTTKARHLLSGLTRPASHVLTQQSTG